MPEPQYVCKKCQCIVVIASMKVHTPRELQAVNDELCLDCAPYPETVKSI